MALEVKLYLNRRNFTLDIRAQFEGGITAIFGPSGSGKSTLLHCIAGLLKPDSGIIRLDEEKLFNSRQKLHIPPHQRKIGIVFQDCLLFPHMSVRCNIQYGQTGDKLARREQFEKIVDLLEIEPLLNRSVESLSGGEKKRTALARAILANPRWLLLDEPFSGLDQSLKDQITMFLRRLHKTVSVPMILVSHCIDEIADLADEVVFMEKGRLTAQGKLTVGKDGSACLCHSQNPTDLQQIKSWLINNHSLRLDACRSRIRAI